MGLIGKLFSGLFGGGRNVVAETVGVFRENSEAGAQRRAEFAQAALAQYAGEFQTRTNRTWFDSLVDGLNRLARPIITLTVLGVIPAVMIRPEDMAVAFAALALLPTGYWALVSIIIGFYYGGRMQEKAQNFERSITEAVARSPQVLENISQMRRLRSDSPGVADTGTDAALSMGSTEPSDNPAVLAWREKST